MKMIMNEYAHFKNALVVDLEGDEKSFQIVGLDEIDVALGRISWQSPIAKALIGKKVGDEVKIQRPNGDWIVEIVGLRFE